MVGAIAVALVVAVCGGAYKYGSKLFTSAATKLTHTVTGQPGGTAGGGGNLPVSGDKLTPVGRGVPLTGVGTVSSDGRDVYFAVVSKGHTQVTAVGAGDGKPRWDVSVPVEPADIRVTATAGLVVVDGAKSALDGGKDVRAVLDAKSGQLRWKSPWESRYDVAYLGTDEIVSAQWPAPQATMRVNLLTGQAKWTKPANDETVAFTERRASAAFVWPGQAAAPAVVTQADNSLNSGTAPFHEWLAISPAVFVELDTKSGKGIVRDTNTGNQLAAGAAPLRNETGLWTVFDGALIGAATDDASPGRAKVLAYRLDRMGEAWHADLDANAEVKGVRPCGQHLVCVYTETSGTSDQAVMAYDVPSGKAAWPQPRTAQFAEHPRWYVLGGHLLYGDGTFGEIRAVVLDAGDGRREKKVGEKDQGPSIVAGDGKRAVLSDVQVQGLSGSTHWELSVLDVEHGTRSPGVDVGTEPPKEVQLTGDLLTVVTAAKELRAWRVPGGAN